MWIDYEQENNCCLISIEEKGKDGSDKGLTLHECAERLDINYLKVRQIEINALKKLSHKRLLADLNDEF
jgi:DNA-directed RNA polymerase sigma subunit (sigma70/sigma32)